MKISSLIERKFGYNQLVTLNEIMKEASDYSEARVFQLLREEVKNSMVIKRSRGLYYVPSKTPFGPSSISSDEVIEKLYLQEGKETVGFLSGLTLKSMLGMTMQHPATVEIFTNNEASRKRVVNVCGRFVVLRKGRTKITNANWKILQFLELINSINYEEVKHFKSLLIDLAKKQGITRALLSEYIPYYPAQVSSKLLIGGILYVLA